MTDENINPPPAGAASGKVLYDCTPWAAESRRLFASLLEGRGVTHAWQGTAVSVAAVDEDLVDGLVEEVMATARPALDPAAARVVYEVGGWPVSLQTAFATDLTASDVAYEWDVNGDLVVAESDEEIVEEILDLLPDPEVVDDSANDGIAVHEVLNELFTHSLRLSSKPKDGAALLGLVEAFSSLDRLALPFGFEQTQWSVLVESLRATRDAIDPPANDTGEAAPSDSEIAALAGRSTELLRQYV